MNRYKNHQLIALIMSDIGLDANRMTEEHYYQAFDDVLRSAMFDSVCPGACRQCGGVQDCEPDATRNHCYDCGAGAVVSLPVLAGVM